MTPAPFPKLIIACVLDGAPTQSVSSCTETMINWRG